jgi:hypothetical protein
MQRQTRPQSSVSEYMANNLSRQRRPRRNIRVSQGRIEPHRPLSSFDNTNQTQTPSAVINNELQNYKIPAFFSNHIQNLTINTQPGIDIRQILRESIENTHNYAQITTNTRIPKREKRRNEVKPKKKILSPGSNKQAQKEKADLKKIMADKVKQLQICKHLSKKDAEAYLVEAVKAIGGD